MVPASLNSWRCCNSSSSRLFFSDNPEFFSAFLQNVNGEFASHSAARADVFRICNIKIHINKNLLTQKTKLLQAVLYAIIDYIPGPRVHTGTTPDAFD